MKQKEEIEMKQEESNIKQQCSGNTKDIYVYFD